MTKKTPLHIAIIAPSSVVPAAELRAGVDFLEKKGFNLDIHPTVFGQDYFYPANDNTRASVILDYAFREDIDVLWFARGGYGATHLLPLLKKATIKKKPKKKTLLGFSDATAILEFVRVNWGWNTIHAPMPSGKTFPHLKPSEWTSVLEQLELATIGRKVGSLSAASSFSSLKPVFLPKNTTAKKVITAPLVGGNFSVWNSLIGTPYAGNAKAKILFLEDIQENIARLNRMIHHLEQSGGFKGVKAIVLGDFLDCNDTVMKINDQPIRKLYPADEALDYIFRQLGERLQIPIWKNVPAGHGPNFHALSLGRKYSLNPQGKLILT
jgi:muramoyltetrapeptide carboxypeptidase